MSQDGNGNSTGAGLTPLIFEGATVRVVQIEGEPHFVGKDVAERLGYTNPNKAMNDHCKGVTKRYPLQTPGGMQDARVLSEPDVLRLIVKSGLPAAERFERWVFEDVLPAIRKTGRYGAPDPMAVLSDPAALRTLLLENVEKRIELEGRLAEQAPKIEALDRIAVSEGSFCVTDAAKTLQIRPKVLFAFLRQNGWIYTRAGGAGEVAYQARLVDGSLEHKTTTVLRTDGSEKTVTQVRITPKGLTKLATLLPPTATAA